MGGALQALNRTQIRIKRRKIIQRTPVNALQFYIMADPFIVSHIRRLPIFARCNDEQLDALAGMFQMFRYAAGQPLFQQGERSQALYLFVSGEGQLMQTLPNGAQQIMSVVRPGEYVGEASLFAGNPREMSAVVTQDSVVLALQKVSLDSVLAARQDIRAALAIRQEDRGQLRIQQEQGVRGDEQVLLTTRRHPWVILGQVVRAAFAAALCIALAIILGRLPAAGTLALIVAGAGVILPVVGAIYWVLEWRNDFFTITSQRVIHEDRSFLTGAVRREQMLLGSVQTVDLQRVGLVAELAGFGDVLLGSPGQANPLTLDHIPDPARVQQLIFAQTQLRHSGTPITTTQRGSGRGEYGGLFPPMTFTDGRRLVLHKHWAVLVRYIVRPLFGFVALAILIVIAGVFQKQLGATLTGPVIALFAALWIAVNSFFVLWGYLAWIGEVYVIDDEMLLEIKQTPFRFRESRVQTGMAQVQNVNSTVRSILGRIFNYGDVTIQTAAPGSSGRVDFREIANPARVADEILRRLSVRR